MHKILRLFLVIALVVLAFSAGAACVVRAQYGRSLYSDNFRAGRMPGMMKEGGMMLGWDNDGLSGSMERWGNSVRLERLFGTITKIEGNKITVLDNAAKEDVIVSDQSTIIVQSSAEIGLASLKTGQNVVIMYSVLQDNQWLARTIDVQ